MKRIVGKIEIDYDHKDRLPRSRFDAYIPHSSITHPYLEVISEAHGKPFLYKFPSSCKSLRKDMIFPTTIADLYVRK